MSGAAQISGDTSRHKSTVCSQILSEVVRHRVSAVAVHGTAARMYPHITTTFFVLVREHETILVYAYEEHRGLGEEIIIIIIISWDFRICHLRNSGDQRTNVIIRKRYFLSQAISKLET